MTSPIEQFRDAIRSAGLPPPDVIQPGRWHKFPGYQKDTKNRAAWCFMFDDMRGGVFGDFSTNTESIWQAGNTTPYTEAEREANRAQFTAAKAQRETDKAACQQSAATDAAQRLKAATTCTQHSYPDSKGVQCHGVKVEADGFLIVPMRDTAGKLWNIERINPADSKDKKGLPGGRRIGLLHGIGKPNGLLIVGEGYATCASIHECTGHAVAVAFNAGNLEPVALALRAKYPALKIIIAADDDHQTDGNPGMTKARAAAQAVGGFLAVPTFPAGRPDKATDFNDLHQLAGPDAVKGCIESAALCEVSATVQADWPELQPLIAQIDPQEYPIDALPAAMRCAVQEVAGFVKAPIPLIAASALAAISLAIQAHTDVQRADKLHGPCGLFLLAIADSGERKSTCDGFFTKAIRDYEAEQYEAAKPLVTAYKSDVEVWEAQRSGLKEKIKSLAKEGKSSTAQVKELHDLDKNKPIAPRVPRLIYGDATPEALQYALAKQWPSAGVISSEAGSVLGSHGMGKESVMRNLATLNKLWDGTDLQTERRSTESFTVRGARLTMALQVQEATIRAFFASTNGLARGTGFLARFLVSWPLSTQGTRHFTEAPANWPALATFNSRLTLILNRPAPIDENGALTPDMLQLSPDAKAHWIAFHNAIESELSTGGELFDVRDVASKTADNAARLAALFHTFTGSIGPIDVEAMESGGQIAAWHLTEARRFLSELAMPLELANPARLESWMLDYCQRENTDSVPTREVQRCGPGGLRDKAAFLQAIKELAELGRARLVQVSKKRLIQIRPELLQRGAA